MADEVIAKIDTDGRAAEAAAAAPARPAAPRRTVAAAPAPQRLRSAAAPSRCNGTSNGCRPRPRSRRRTTSRRATSPAPGAMAASPRAMCSAQSASSASEAAASRGQWSTGCAGCAPNDSRGPHRAARAMSRLRQRIAERLVQSQSTAAILTTFNEVNMAPVIRPAQSLQGQVREGARREAGLHVVLRESGDACAEKVSGGQRLGRRHRHRLSRLLRHRHRRRPQRGLVVPILRNVDQMWFADIEKKIAEFASKAKDGKLTIEELSGGTFSISNGGVFGSMLSTPIINPPQSAILGVHATKDRPVVENGQIVIRPMNYLAMTYDHRIIDGREAVLALVAMKEALEDPAARPRHVRRRRAPTSSSNSPRGVRPHYHASSRSRRLGCCRGSRRRSIRRSRGRGSVYGCAARCRPLARRRCGGIAGCSPSRAGSCGSSLVATLFAGIGSSLRAAVDLRAARGT